MGALNVRLPESLHARIRRLAEREGISINQFILLATAEKATLLEAAQAGLDYVAARAARAARARQQEANPRQVFLDYVAGAADVEPDAEDRLDSVN